MDHPANPLSQAAHGRIEGWPAWSELVRTALQEAAEHASAIHLQDPDFAHWPLGERTCVESLDRWVLAQGRSRATLVALGWGAVVRQHPRFLRWRTPWGHRVACLTVPDDQISSMTGFAPLLVIEGRLALQIVDAERGIGHWSRDASSVRALWLQGDAISQRSLDSGISATLGL